MAFLTPERPARYTSILGGLTVGWDVCGSCHRHVLVCDCETGPSEPGFLAAERTAEDPPITASTSDKRAAA